MILRPGVDEEPPRYCHVLSIDEQITDCRKELVSGSTSTPEGGHITSPAGTWECVVETSVREFVEMHMGFMDAVCEDGETTDLDPMWIATVFNNQRDFDAGCGFWAGQGMLVLRKEEAPRFPDRLAWMLRDLDTRFINDRRPGFEVCRITLPSFELVFDDGVVLKIEVLANFFRFGYFDIVYVYRWVNLPLTPANLLRLWNWANAERIRLPRVVVEVMGSIFLRKILCVSLVTTSRLTSRCSKVSDSSTVNSHIE